MLFVYPMWDSESERIGKRRCTPFGYALHVAAELLGVIGGIVLLVTLGGWAWKGLGGTFRVGMLWQAALPLSAGVVSAALYHFSWWMALLKGFRYDGDRREASWNEQGTRVTFTTLTHAK